MPKGDTNYKIFLDVIEVNASDKMRQALSSATKCPMDCHMALNRNAIPLLQGIAHLPDMERECNNLIHQVQTNGLIVICPNAK